MARRPRVLWVSPSVPDHEGGGDQLRQAYLLDHVGVVADVHLVLPEEPTDVRVRAAVTDVDVVAQPPPVAERRVDRLLHLAARDPWFVRRAAGTRDRLAGTVARLAPTADLVVVEHLELARLREVVAGGRWLLTVHLAHSRHLTHLASAVDGRQRWFWNLDADRAARFERWAVQAYDRVVAVSDADAEVLGDVVVVPNGVDLSTAPTPLPPEPRVVLTGSLDFAPNSDGVAWFLDQVWGHVRQRVPGVTLDVVGRRPTAETVARVRAAPSVTLSPNVPAIAPYLEAARTAIVPIRVGAGTRLKALQALAAGRPVVGTAIGLEGLGLVDGEHALVREGAAAFADAVATTLTDDGLAAALARQGRAHVEAHFGWDAVASRLLDTIKELAARE